MILALRLACTNETGYCSCDNDLAHIEAQGVPTDPGCLKPVQACSWVNSVIAAHLPHRRCLLAVQAKRSPFMSLAGARSAFQYGRTGSHLTQPYRLTVTTCSLYQKWRLLLNRV